MSYYNDLAHELRRRGCEENTVAEVLHTVDDAASAGNSPQEEFGTAKEYAAQYEGPRKSTPGQRALGVFGTIGIVLVALNAIWPNVIGNDFPFFPLFLIIPCVFAGVVVGAFVDNRLPSGFASTQPKNPAQ